MAAMKIFAERYVEAIHTWARQHPTVTLDDVADVLDTYPEKRFVDRFLADPETFLAEHPKVRSCSKNK